MKNRNVLALGLATALSVSSANAFVLTGSVHDAKGKAVKGAELSLIGTEYSAVSDGVGSFTIRDTPINTTTIKPVVNPGFVRVDNGILSYSQAASAPLARIVGL